MLLASSQLRRNSHAAALGTQLERFPIYPASVCALSFRLRPEMISYLEGVKSRRHHVRPHLLPVDHIASELGVATHGARSRTLVEALVDVLGRQRQLAETPCHLEDLSGFAAARHLIGCVPGGWLSCWFRGWWVLCRYRINGGRVHRFIFRALGDDEELN